MTHIQQRRDTAANWMAYDPVLMAGEAGHETDTGKWKMGDGVTVWSALYYKMGVDSVAGKVGAVNLDVDDVDGAAPLASPALTGTPTAPHPASSDNSTRLATTGYVKTLINNLIDGAPGTLDTLNELAAALADDANFAASMTASLATKAPLASPALTGNPTAPTPAPGDNDTSIATSAFVKAAIDAAIAAAVQDSGQRDITALADAAFRSAYPNSRVFVRRIGPKVYVTINLRDNAAGAAVTVMSAATAVFPAGFRQPQGLAGTRRQAVGLSFRSSDGGIGGAQLLVTDTTFATDLAMYGLAVGGQAQAVIDFTTSEAWPGSLPGVPSGL